MPDSEQTVLSLVDANVARDPSHAAVIFENQIWTYGDLAAASRRIASALLQRGIAPGDRVSIFAANTPRFYVAYFAVLRCGAALFPINTELASEEIRYIIAKVDPVLIITDEPMHERAIAAIPEGIPDCRLVRFETLRHEGRPGIGTDDFPSRSSQDVALVVHTSGTTARPKGVIATDHMELASAKALHDCWDIRTSDISVCALPLSYTFGLLSASFAAFCAGATVLLLRKFNPVRVLEEMARHRATYMVGVPTMYAMMLEHVQQTSRRYDLSSVRMIATSGAPITLRIKEEFLAAFGIVLRDYYAFSECTPVISFNLRTDPELPPAGSVGRLVRGAQVAILDEDGKPAKTGESGCLWVYSDRLTQGYYMDQERTESTFCNGWFKTGDLAYRDSLGYYFITGRDRDQVISGGQKIAATEVESVISRMPEVAQVAVVGSPHPILGEIVKAVVICRNERQPLDAASVIEFCKNHLASYKVPREVEFRSTLPISPAGKILKRKLI